MRALTLRPWWAHAVAHFGKRIENRKRPIPPALVGQRIAIHAGRESWRDFAWLDELRAAAPSRDAVPRGIVPIPSDWPDRPADRLDVRARCIVATAVLEECTTAVPGRLPAWADPGSPWWWFLGDVRTLAQPVRVHRGQLGLWRLPADVVAQLEAA